MDLKYVCSLRQLQLSILQILCKHKDPTSSTSFVDKTKCDGDTELTHATNWFSRVTIRSFEEVPQVGRMLFSKLSFVGYGVGSESYDSVFNDTARERWTAPSGDEVRSQHLYFGRAKLEYESGEILLNVL